MTRLKLTIALLASHYAVYWITAYRYELDAIEHGVAARVYVNGERRFQWVEIQQTGRWISRLSNPEESVK